MPINFTQQERQTLLNNLSNGRRNAIGAKRLCNLISFPNSSNQVRLRSLIKECIEHDGDLIGAATGRPAGFFIINDVTELNVYMDSLEGRTRSDNTRRSALIRNWNSVNTPTTKTGLAIS